MSVNHFREIYSRSTLCIVEQLIDFTVATYYASEIIGFRYILCVIDVFDKITMCRTVET